jgi:hypothetical protein
MSEINIDVVSTGSNDAILAVGEMLPNKIVAMNVPHMLLQICGRLGSTHKLRRLRLFGHGAPGLICVGDVPAGLNLNSTEENLSQHSLATIRCVGHRIVNGLGQTMHTEYFLLNVEPLAQLTHRFAPSGWAELHACHVAEGNIGERLLKMLASLWRVNVAGATGDQVPGGGLENTLIVARPGGGISHHLPPLPLPRHPMANPDVPLFAGAVPPPMGSI